MYREIRRNEIEIIRRIHFITFNGFGREILLVCLLYEY